MSTTIANFTVTQEFTDSFSAVSGDYNPLHIDPVSARRFQFGSTVIHGICGFLKAFDVYIGIQDQPVIIKSLKIQFNRPIRHNDVVEIVHQKLLDGVIRLELFSSGKRVQIIDVEVDQTSRNVLHHIKSNLKNSNSRSNIPNELEYRDSVALNSEIDLYWDSEHVKTMFPHLFFNIPHSQIAVLFGTTQIVGMKCPGLHSVYGGLTISFNGEIDGFSPKLKYSVIHSDDRFSLVKIAVNHACAKGEIEAFFRPKPVQQPEYLSIKELVSPHQFSHQHALIVGGSRGAGEATAKLIAGGGGKVTITYANGKSDAEKIQSDIFAHNGDCKLVRYNVLSPVFESVEIFSNHPVTHIYYFASPLIEKSDLLIWDVKLFNKFVSFYLTGLAQLVDKFISIPGYRKKGLVIFMPSTVYIDEPQKGFTEYITAKSAAESLLKQIQLKYPWIKYQAPRLPRMLTDQTSGVADDKPIAASKIILDAIVNTDLK